MKRVLIIEDDKSLGTVIQHKIKEGGYDVVHVVDGESGLHEVTIRKYDVVICDLSLPKMSGHTVLRSIRLKDPQVPIISITNFAQDENEILSYMNGANVFHKKPLRFDVLLSQIKMLLERAKQSDYAEIGDIVIDNEKRVVKKSGKIIPLSHKEFDVLYIFVNSPGEVFTRRELIEKTTASAVEVEDGSIDTIISRIRKKLGTYKDSHVIDTVYKQGYRLSLLYLE
ncbi:MAG: response regulator transcription factor [Candidatus Dojkabacteria bacterium]|nr:MAG: response regulator transcription factor [Candidatus Dojkabacteria bacterium]